MTRSRRTYCVIRVARRGITGVLAGPVRAIQPAIRRTGCDWRYEPLLHAYRVPLRALDEVVRALESAGHEVIQKEDVA